MSNTIEELRIRLREKLSEAEQPKPNSFKGVLRGAKMGGEGVGSIVRGIGKASKAAGPGLAQAWAGARHAATGVRIAGTHAARGMGSVIKNHPLKSVAVASTLGALAAGGLHSNPSQQAPSGGRIYSSTRGLDEPSGPSHRTVYSGAQTLQMPTTPKPPRDYTKDTLHDLAKQYGARGSTVEIRYESLKEHLRKRLDERLS